MISAAPCSVGRKTCRLLALPVFLLCAALSVSPSSSSAAPAGTVQDLDSDNGLPDIKLGTPLKSFTGLQLKEDTGRWQSYRLPGDKLKYLGYDITGVVLNFFKDQLYSIDVNFESRGTTTRLLKVFEQKYGKDHTFETRKLLEATTETETREWDGAKTFLVVKTAGNYHGGVARFIDRKMWDQLAEPRKEHAAQLHRMLDGSYTNGDF